MVVGFWARITIVALGTFAVQNYSSAQTMEDSISLTYEAPEGLASVGQMEAMVSNTRDANFNHIVTTGSIASGGTGTSSTSSGGASAVGNLINVSVVGSNNTVIVNANQVNSGSQQAIVAGPQIQGNTTTTPIIGVQAVSTGN